MAFDNVRNILSIHSPLSSLKLLCVAANFSRPRFRPLWRSMLQPFVHDGEVDVQYRCAESDRKIHLRMSELESDFLSALELGAGDTYTIDRGFHPDLVIDGGGNIGLFTLRVSAMESAAGNKPQFVIYEPMPHNSQQCQRHLDENHVEAKIVNACLGGSRRSLPFYSRESVNSSFDPSRPYKEVVEMPVHLLKDAISNVPAERILIKLDIEGMEVEALSAFLPEETRPVYIVGEVHNVPVNVPLMERLFKAYGWSYDFGPLVDAETVFHACSPAALPLLRSMPAPSAAASHATAA